MTRHYKGLRTHNHLIRKQTRNDLVKLAICLIVFTCLIHRLYVFIMSHTRLDSIYTLWLPECQETSPLAVT